MSERAGTPADVAVERGKSARFAIDVSATGRISCATGRNSGVAATVDTQYRVGSGGVTAANPSQPLPFYSDGRASLAPPITCGVTWNDAPRPYRVIARITADPNTPVGSYTLNLPAGLSNPGLAFLEPLRDDSPSRITVRVVDPLPPPAENDSVNLLPVTGTVLVRFPDDHIERVTEPIHIPQNSIVNTLKGHVDLVSDGDGRGKPQTVELWSGRFRVGYSRESVPETARRTSKPYTELRLLGAFDRRCTDANARRAHTSRRRRKRRRLWGRGRGRYRTRGRRGAATVRGTWWLTEDSCRGTKVTVRQGVVTMRDFALERNFRLRAPRSYLASPPGATNGHG